jgi:microcystin-dependent protein
MMTAFGFAQKYFAQCNGQLLPIAQNQALFSLLGTTYGGDGRVTFALPDLRSRTPVGGIPSSSPNWNPPQYLMGQASGTENVTLISTELPSHTHSVTLTTATGTRSSPRGAGTTLGASDPSTDMFYGPAAMLMPLGGGPLSPAGGSAPHPNVQPYTTINFNIALQGIFPSRN